VDQSKRSTVSMAASNPLALQPTAELKDAIVAKNKEAVMCAIDRGGDLLSVIVGAHMILEGHIGVRSIVAIAILLPYHLEEVLGHPRCPEMSHVFGLDGKTIATFIAEYEMPQGAREAAIAAIAQSDKCRRLCLATKKCDTEMGSRMLYSAFISFLKGTEVGPSFLPKRYIAENSKPMDDGILVLLAKAGILSNHVITLCLASRRTDTAANVKFVRDMLVAGVLLRSHTSVIPLRGDMGRMLMLEAEGTYPENFIGMSPPLLQIRGGRRCRGRFIITAFAITDEDGLPQMKLVMATAREKFAAVLPKALSGNTTAFAAASVAASVRHDHRYPYRYLQRHPQE
jgi:hypothetical protein